MTLGGVVGCEDDGAVTPDAAVDAAPLPDVSPVAPDPDFDEDFVGYGSEVTVTTLLQTRRSRYPEDEFLVDRYGRPRLPMDELGQVHPQPGEPHLVRDDLAVGDATAPVSRSLLYFAHLSDAQIIDTQSPSYVPSNKYSVAGDAVPAFHQNGPLAPHLLDAQVQTANQFTLQRSYDFLIHTGDAVEDAQQNELEWFLTIMDGGELYPDSGTPVDPVPGPDNDAWDPFVAQGVASGVPWYAVVGNHDLGVSGNFPPGLIADANSEPILSQLTPLLAQLELTLPGVSTADHAPNVLQGADMPAFTSELPTLHVDELWDEDYILALEAGSVAPDADRAPLDDCAYIDAHFNTGTSPVGHGFTAEGRQHCQGNYVVDPVPGVPLRLLVLDTGPHVGGVEGILTPPLNEDGSVNQALVGDPTADQLAWLTAELERAQTENVAVIVASHHPSKSIAEGNSFTELIATFFPDEVELDALWREHFVYPEQSLSGPDFRDLLASYDNVVLHLVGHSHANKVNVVCPDGDLIDGEEATAGQVCAPPPVGRTAANGYWEVMAASPRDWPNQFRISELVDHGDGTGSIYSTVVDIHSGPGSLARLGLLLATADEQANRKYLEQSRGTLLDRNVQLRFAWPPSLITALATVDAATRIESITTLAQPAPGVAVLPTWP